jgi:CTP:molybdopterin cytidylyltransferase MocA
LDRSDSGPVAAAILAAGRGERFGGDTPKPLVTFRGRPLIAYAIDAVNGSGLAPLFVVTGNAADAVAAAVPADVEVVRNDAWATGNASSLVALLRTLRDRTGIEAVVIGLADQPLVGAGAYRRIAATDGELVVPTYDGEPGNPVKLARTLWPEAMELRGDAGARVLMRDRVVDRVDCTETGSAADIDTLEDLERLQQEDQ